MPFSADQVPLFLAVLDAGSFSAAARKLGRVPSAVSMAIAQLEAELDLQLFDRSGREPVPSAAARALEPQARLLAEQLQLLNWQAQSLHAGLEERLTLAIAPELLVRTGASRCTSWCMNFRPCPSRCSQRPRSMRWSSCMRAAPIWPWCSSGQPWTGARVSRKWAARHWWP